MYYLLDKNKNPYPVDLDKFSSTSDCESTSIVKKTYLRKYNIEVSTIFMCVSYNFSPNGQPILFETMIFCPDYEEYNCWQQRYCTWKQARAGHNEAVRLIIKYIRLMKQGENND